MTLFNFASIIRGFVAVALALIVTVNAGTINNSTSPIVKDSLGDLFVFAISWQPEFCFNMSNTYPGCAAPKDYWKTHFTIHGLWPQYSAGGYPADCTTEAFDPNIVNEIGWDTMTTNWPNVKYAETDANYTEFWTHEWTKHGTCTGLSQYNYFTYGLNVHTQIGTPDLVINNIGGSVDGQQLRAAFGGSGYVSLQCSAGAYLNGVYSCFSNVNGIPTEKIACPADVLAEDTCTSTTVYIVSF